MPQPSSPKKTTYTLPLSSRDASPAVPRGYVLLPPPTDPPYTLRLEIRGSSPVCRQGTLWVNIPESAEEFDREAFRAFK